MSVRLMQDRGCGDPAELAHLSDQLTGIIRSEMVWDFRVNDAHIQRTLMLAEAGKIHDIKPVWIKRILDAQNPDGGWNDIHPVVELGERSFGYGSRWLAIKSNQSNFHATAQGIWLLCLLLQQYDSISN